MVAGFIKDIKEKYWDNRNLISNIYSKRENPRKPISLSLKAFFYNLNLTAPGLEKVGEYCQKGYFDEASVELLKYYRRRENPRFFFNLKTKETLKDLISTDFPASYKITISKADLACGHIFDILGTGQVRLGDTIDWSSDFRGKRWIYGHYEELKKLLYKNNFNNPHYIGDIKIPWEFNKHAHFVDLGKAYFLTDNEQYAVELFSQMTNWIDSNPVNMGVGWMENLIAAQRAISWIFALFLCLHSKHLTGELFAKILSSLLFHAVYINEHLELGELSSNHLFGNLGGLFFLSYVFPEFKECAYWKQRSLQLYVSELDKQVYKDGVQYEQSLSYHRYVVEFCLLPVLLGHINREALPDLYLIKLVDMLEYMMHMTQPSGLIQPISDADGARVWNFNNADIRDFRSYLTIGALLFNRTDFKYVSGEQCEELLWLLGPEAYMGFKQMPSIQPPCNSKQFHDGGYYIMRDGWEKDSSWLFFDCGNIGMGNLPEKESIGTHGHSDLLTFGLTANGETFITDIGSYAYTSSKTWHDYFRGSRGHNVILVDSEDQSVLTTTWALKDRARPKNVSFVEKEGFVYVKGTHDGYRRLADPVFHTREILFVKNQTFIIIKDTLEGSKSHRLDFLIHLSPQCIVSQRRDGGCLIRGKKEDLKLIPYFITNKSVFCSLEKGQENPVSGWYSPDYGTKEPSYTIHYYGEFDLPIEIITWISWEKGLFTTPDINNLREVWDFYLQKKTT